MASYQGMEVIKNLVGHSGCAIQLCLRGDAYFVRKTSSSQQYNSRLKKQIEKQISLSCYIQTPDVYDVGEIDDLAYFDMEYIRGQGFVSYAPLQSVTTMCDLVERLCEAISTLSATRQRDLDPRLFLSKLDDLSRTVPLNPFYAAHSSFLRPLIDSLKRRPWTGVPKTLCHGDLTVENMLLTDDGAIVFIDMLDGDLESIWLDIAKLLQDLRSGWSLRSLLWAGETAPSSRLLRTLTHYLADEIETQIARTLPQFSAVSQELRAVQALRVLPYVKDSAVYSHVVKGLKDLTKMREFV